MLQPTNLPREMREAEIETLFTNSVVWEKKSWLNSIKRNNSKYFLRNSFHTLEKLSWEELLQGERNDVSSIRKKVNIYIAAYYF